MKLIKKFFRDEEFFKKDEEGRSLFYPWGYPGEAFFIDDKQKRSVSIFIYSGFVLFALSIFAIIFLDIKDIHILYYSGLALFMFFPLLYLCGVHFFTKDLNAHLVPVEQPKKGSFFILIHIVGFQVLGMYMALNDKNLSPSVSLNLVALSAIYTIYISFVLVTIGKKGCFFARKKCL